MRNGSPLRGSQAVGFKISSIICEDVPKSQPHAPSDNSRIDEQHVEPNHPNETWDPWDDLGDSAALGLDVDLDDQTIADLLDDGGDMEDTSLAPPVVLRAETINCSERWPSK